MLISRQLWIGIFIFGILTNLCLAQSKSKDDFSIYPGLTGDGGEYSCGNFVEDDLVPTKRYAWKQYISGFMTGLNITRNRVTKQDVSSLYLWTQNWCKKNPFGVVTSAILKLDAELGKGKLPVWMDGLILPEK